VAHIEDRHVDAAVQGLDEGHDFAAAPDVEARQRLVHQKKAGPREQRAADGDALRLTAGKAMRPPREERSEAEKRDRLISPDGAAAALRAIVEIFADAQMRKEPRVLKDIADAARLRRLRDLPVAVEKDIAAQ